jgi:hypothetical protein
VDRRSFRLAILLTCLGFFLLPRAAFSAPKDAAASKIAEDAINNDYLSLRFNEAAKKLKSAVAMCAGNACSPQVRARIHRDLGVVLIAGLNKTGEGKKAFVEAVKADPSITLDKDLTTPAIEQAFKAARGSSGAAAAPPPPSAPVGGPSAGGDIVHTPASEQAVLTPLPVYAELPSGITASKVLVMYKPFGATDWQKMELKKLGSGYGGEIPCQAIGSTTGDLSYYIQANDAEGDVVASSGTRKAPNRVPIQNEIAGEAPHLPGRPAPAKCKDKADCPPGFPGCSAKKGGKAWGASCEKDRECGDGLACKSGTCETGEKSESGEPAASGRSCETSSDCDTGEKCNAEKVCELAGGHRKKIWVGVHVQQDFSFVPAQQDVCGTPDNNPPNNVTCYDDQDFLYTGFPLASDPDHVNGNEILGGTRRSNLRLLVDFSYLFSPNFSAGARIGYVLGIGPDRPALAKFHLEARVAYWFGSDPFAKKGIRPYIAVAGGAAEVNDKFTAQIYEYKCQDPMITEEQCMNMGYPGKNPTLTVWRRGAKTFAGGAVGAMLPIGNNMGLVAEVKVQTFFVSSALTVAPVIGYAFGF